MRRNSANKPRYPKYATFGNRRGGNKIPDPIPTHLLIKKAEPVVAEDVYTPKHRFTDFAVHPQLQQTIASKKYVTPTPIQDQAIPYLLEGRDVVGIANTGTGKTAAFLIPSINKLLQDRSKKLLIITPTRELAVQIQQEAFELTRGMKLYSTLVIGGVSMHPQKQQLRRNPQIVIGTPGRLTDMQEQGFIRFGEYQSIVLDEVDRMLEMGFVQPVTRIIKQLPQERQSMFFSATMSSEIERVMHSVMQNHITISVKKRETSNNVDQDVVRVEGRDKMTVLDEVLRSEGFERVIVFGRTKHGIDKIEKILARQGHLVTAIHGNKRQNQRQRALQDFKNGRATILLATDVAARGLDIPDVSHVINYDHPATYQEYVHRIGRTGRANKKGTALTFVD
ncbi:MAG: DEAD/DEAH box helicase [Patescibacteria group bacterium]